MKVQHERTEASPHRWRFDCQFALDSTDRGTESDVSSTGPLGSCNETVLCQQVALTTPPSHNISLCLLLFHLGAVQPEPGLC